MIEVPRECPIKGPCLILRSRSLFLLSSEDLDDLVCDVSGPVLVGDQKVMECIAVNKTEGCEIFKAAQSLDLDREIQRRTEEVINPFHLEDFQV